MLLHKCEELILFSKVTQTANFSTVSALLLNLMDILFPIEKTVSHNTYLTMIYNLMQQTLSKQVTVFSAHVISKQLQERAG